MERANHRNCNRLARVLAGQTGAAPFWLTGVVALMLTAATGAGVLWLAFQESAGAGIDKAIAALGGGPAPGPLQFRHFAVRDPSAAAPGVAGRLTLAVEALVEGSATAWYISEEGSHPPPAGHPGWQTELPATIALSPGDGERIIYIWARDTWGRRAEGMTTVLVDTVPPSPPAVDFPTRPPGSSSADPIVHMRWDPAADPSPGSGLAGYSIAWGPADAHAADTLTLDGAATTARSPQLATGHWYVIIRPRDRAGNWGEAVRYGPFVVLEEQPKFGATPNAAGPGAGEESDPPAAGSDAVGPGDQPAGSPGSAGGSTAGGTAGGTSTGSAGGTSAGSDGTPATGADSVVILRFRLTDPLTGSSELTSSLYLVADSEAVGPVAAWALTEESVAPARDDPRWQPHRPLSLPLSPGDGRRAAYLWVRSSAGAATGAYAEIQVDTVPPLAVRLASRSHVPGEPQNRRDVTMVWPASADPDPASGLTRYEFRWTERSGVTFPGASGTLPPDATTVTATLPEGEWTFTIRPVDRAGNTGREASFGPILIALEEPIAISSFTLADPVTGRTEFTSGADLRVAIADSGPVVAWLLTEGRARPAPDDPAWVAKRPTAFRLATWEGPHTVTLWVRSRSGITATAQAAIHLDTVAPRGPSNLASTTHKPGSRSQIPDVTVTWDPAADPSPGSGVVAYLVRWVDAQGVTLEGSSQRLPAGATSVTQSLPNGAWYFVIQALDQANNAGEPVTLGPFYITAGVIP